MPTTTTIPTTNGYILYILSGLKHIDLDVSFNTLYASLTKNGPTYASRLFRNFELHSLENFYCTEMPLFLFLKDFLLFVDFCLN